MSIAKSTDPHEAWKEIQVLVRIINDILDVWQKEQFNIIKNYNSISCEKIFRPWILFNKRYYACSVIMNEDGGKIIEYNEPKLYWKGMAKVRRNTSDFTYNLEDTIINMIFRREDSEVIFQYIRELNNGFENNNWEYVCEKCGISKSVDESTSQNYIACRNANTYLNKNYDAGATPYLGIFSRGGYPRFINNKLVKSEKDTGEFIIAFDENDEWELRKMGFKLDYNTYKYKVFIKKIEPLLKLVFNKTFSEVIIDKDSLWEV
jgi:DNA polymerase elongation subunit (family B)